MAFMWSSQSSRSATFTWRRMMSQMRPWGLAARESWELLTIYCKGAQVETPAPTTLRPVPLRTVWVVAELSRETR